MENKTMLVKALIAIFIFATVITIITVGFAPYLLPNHLIPTGNIFGSFSNTTFGTLLTKLPTTTPEVMAKKIHNVRYLSKKESFDLLTFNTINLFNINIL